MIHEADAAVIAAGAFGASSAFRRGKRGQRVALLERHTVASQTSPRAAGLTQQIRTDTVMTQLAMRSVTKIEQFAEDTGEALAFHQSGSLKLARTPEFAEQVHDEVERGQALGLDIHHVSAMEAQRPAPLLKAP